MSGIVDLPPFPPASFPTPSKTAIARAQLRATGLALRTDAILGSLLLVGLAVLLSFDSDRTGGINADLVNVALQLSVLALFVPMSVWKSDSPSRRTYHAGMPLRVGEHNLAKVLSGWTWMMAFVASYILLLIAAAMITGGSIATGTGWERQLAGELGSDFKSQDITFHGNAWLWLVPFGAVTAAYMLSSVVSLLMDHPWRFMAGLILVVVVLFAATLDEGLRIKPLASVLDLLLTARYGLLTLFSGVPDGVPDGKDWALATALWCSTAFAGVLMAAFRRSGQ